MPPPSAHSPQPGTGPFFFCLRHTVAAGAVGIAMVGELDVAAADDARDAIRRARAHGAEVVCDLHDVSFIDPCGLHVLLDAAASARQDNAHLAIVNPSACVRRLTRLLGLEAELQPHAVPTPPRLMRADRRSIHDRARFRSA